MRVIQIAFVLIACMTISCAKESALDKSQAAAKLDYGSNLLYVKEASYTISPSTAFRTNCGEAGTYAAFPNTLKIDENSGAITVSPKDNDGTEQAGLRYKITWKSKTSGKADSTFITLSGITYVDKFYNLAQGDSIIYPIYNSDPTKTAPAGNYDLTSNGKFAINPGNGQVDIKECIRRGFFDKPLNGSWNQQKVKYRINDNGSSLTSSIDVIIYYYDTMEDVPKNVSALMQAHQLMSLGVNRSLIPATSGAYDRNLSSDLSLLKPRPPCIVIVGH